MNRTATDGAATEPGRGREDAPRSVIELQSELSRLSDKRVMLCLTDNRRRMVSAKRLPGGALEVRLQRAFLAAPPEVVEEIACLVAGRRTDKKALRAFLHGNAVFAAETVTAAPPARRKRGADAASAHHDIAEYAARLNATYLGGRSKAAVVWGRRNKARVRRSIRFACYDPARNVVIMNRKLDSPDIPGYFVEFVLFHEMLHEVLGIGARADGKRDIHGRLFKLMESTYPDYDKALRYEKELCKKLHLL